MRPFLLIGNYGVGNVGDEALREYFFRRFPEVSWVPVSAKPGAVGVPRLPFGFRSLFTPWWRTIRAYRRCGGVVLGGGSLFTDAESVVAPLLWWWHVALAVFFRKPVLLAFQGIGPFRTRAGEWLARWAGRKAAFLSVRDALSFRRVERWGLHKKCILSFDPIFSHVYACKTCVRSNKLLIIPRGNSSSLFWEKVKEIQQLRPLTLTLSSTFANASADRRGERELEDVVVVQPRDFSELCAAIASASFLLTQRYHAGIAALALGVPFEAVPQVAGDKLDALNREERGSACLMERVRVGEAALREALRTPSPRGRGQGEGLPKMKCAEGGEVSL